MTKTRINSKGDHKMTITIMKRRKDPPPSVPTSWKFAPNSKQSEDFKDKLRKRIAYNSKNAVRHTTGDYAEDNPENILNNIEAYEKDPKGFKDKYDRDPTNFYINLSSNTTTDLFLLKQEENNRNLRLLFCKGRPKKMHGIWSLFALSFIIFFVWLAVNYGGL